MRVEDVVALAGDRRLAHVADREHPRALLLRLASAASVSAVSPDWETGITMRFGRRSACGSGTRWRDRPRRESRELLDHVLAEQRRVVGGAAGHERHALQSSSSLFAELDAVEVDVELRFVDPRPDRVGDRAGLLEDLLLHEVVVAALLRRDRIPLDDLELAVDRPPIDVDDLDALLAEHGEVAVVQRDDLARVGQDRGNVARQERLLLALPEDDRAAAVLGGHERSGSLSQTRRGHRSPSVAAGLAHRRQQVAARSTRSSIRCAISSVSVSDSISRPRFELGAELAVVLDDAVVDDDDGACTMRVRVSLGGLAVGRPARVADAEMPSSGLVAKRRLEVDELALRAAHLERRPSRIATPAES